MYTLPQQNQPTAEPHHHCGMALKTMLIKKVKPHHMRSDNQSKDLHYFHLHALRDRVDISEASEDPLNLNPDAVLATLIPIRDDIKEMISNFGVLIARQTILYFPYIFLMLCSSIFLILTKLK